MRLLLLTTAAFLAAACNNPSSLPDVEEGHGASQPAAEQPAPQQDVPGSDQPDDDFPEIIIPEQPVMPAIEEDEEAETEGGAEAIEAYEPEPAEDTAPADESDSGAFDLPPPGMTGGPCSYETSTLTGTVIESDAGGALFESPAGEQFYVAEEYVSPVPAVGETMTLERDRILEGTCTPEIYRQVGP